MRLRMCLFAKWHETRLENECIREKNLSDVKIVVSKMQ